MNIVFRTDASVRIGTGHVMRCLTLAEELQRNRCVNILFICRAHEGHLADLIIQKGFDACLLPAPNKQFVPQNHPAHAAWLGASQEEDATQTINIIEHRPKEKIAWLVVDHYGIEANWHKKLRPLTQKIMVIDDLADRKLDCDLLLDQNFYYNARARYNSLVNAKSRLFLGPKYALLRNEFRKLSTTKLSYDKRLKQSRVVMFFGGMDPNNETLKALKGILPLKQSSTCYFDVVLGEKNPYKNEILLFCRQYNNVQVLIQTENIADILSQAFLFVGSAGSITLERCFSGTPALISAVAKNQEQSAVDLAKHNMHEYAGFFKFLTSKNYANNFARIIKDKTRLFHYHTASKQLVDDKGMFEVVDVIFKG